jgi:hypothetical protein
MKHFVAKLILPLLAVAMMNFQCDDDYCDSYEDEPDLQDVTINLDADGDSKTLRLKKYKKWKISAIGTPFASVRYNVYQSEQSFDGITVTVPTNETNAVIIEVDKTSSIKESFVDMEITCKEHDDYTTTRTKRITIIQK